MLLYCIGVSACSDKRPTTHARLCQRANGSICMCLKVRRQRVIILRAHALICRATLQKSLSHFRLCRRKHRRVIMLVCAVVWRYQVQGFGVNHPFGPIIKHQSNEAARAVAKTAPSQALFPIESHATTHHVCAKKISVCAFPLVYKLLAIVHDALTAYKR